MRMGRELEGSCCGRAETGTATAAQAALERWVDYIVSEQGAWETVRTHTGLY